MIAVRSSETTGRECSQNPRFAVLTFLSQRTKKQINEMLPIPVQFYKLQILDVFDNENLLLCDNERQEQTQERGVGRQPGAGEAKEEKRDL